MINITWSKLQIHLIVRDDEIFLNILKVFNEQSKAFTVFSINMIKYERKWKEFPKRGNLFSKVKYGHHFLLFINNTEVKKSHVSGNK